MFLSRSPVGPHRHSVATQARVLIADDDASMRALLETVLQREGYETVSTTNGRDALARLGEQAIDLVLLDVDMPFLDGLRTLRAIRANDRFRTLPVILVTGSIDEAERIRALETGADDYIGKPIPIRELVARVRAQLREQTAWTSELERARQVRRTLNAVLEDLGDASSLLGLSAELAKRLPSALNVDGAAILAFGPEGVRSIAAEGALATRFQPGRVLGQSLGAEIAGRAASGPWIEAAAMTSAADAWLVDVAFIPFRLGAVGSPIGCLAYALRPGGKSGSISHRLPDLIDATEQIVVVLRPAVERAETADTAISRIRQLIDERQFRIVLQPIVRIETGAIVAVEALTRFEDGGAPQVRFEEAASLGLGGPLQLATAAAALEAVSVLDTAVAISINLSAEVIQSQPSLSGLLDSAGRPVIVELTEHERVEDYEALRGALRTLGAKVQLAIDDAGSGFASLRHIFALKPAFVKLDIEWVRTIDRDPIRRALVSGLVHFAAETGCELIAEGIENEAELAALRALGVTLGQGYLLGRPVPASELAQPKTG
jgi:EAL domain-containing protein (putative c-di-GMP-specific phosphodiesterase class I)/DNA-binding NarL/FixJ family response regulator